MSETMSEKDPRDMTAREIVAEAKYLEELDQADSGEPADD